MEEQKYKSVEGDCEVDCIERKWTSVGEPPEKFANGVELKIMHWNMLAQFLSCNFDKIDDSAPIRSWDNRARLMKQHYQHIDADVVCLSEVDSVSGNFGKEAMNLMKMMGDLGYGVEYFEKNNFNSASAIFYKKAKIAVIESGQQLFDPGSSQFFMYGTFYLKDNHDCKFVVGETHLKAKKPNMAARVK